jgi:hypothetical protein
VRPGGGGRAFGRRRFKTRRHGGDVTVQARRGDLRDGRLRVELKYRGASAAVRYLVEP